MLYVKFNIMKKIIIFLIVFLFFSCAQKHNNNIVDIPIGSKKIVSYGNGMQTFNLNGNKFILYRWNNMEPFFIIEVK